MKSLITRQTLNVFTLLTTIMYCISNYIYINIIEISKHKKCP